ncbi:YciI family protein [Haloferula sp. BvORR071]|uniref:YciI family protein n=1 Tax=Haloferula sp. BvORR071 TaxID=1396141 RepID=UPI0009DDC5A0|nr:YciI family protein [Haloferula sp. BvORR071]
MPISGHHPIGSPENPQRGAKQYMFLFRHGTWDEGLPVDEVNKIMDEVTGWFDSLVMQGKVIGGSPLVEGGKSIMMRNGQVAVMDGPFVESKEAVAGYLMVSFDSENEAVEAARTSPLFKHGLVTEVREVASECPLYARLRERTAAMAAV